MGHHHFFGSVQLLSRTVKNTQAIGIQLGRIGFKCQFNTDHFFQLPQCVERILRMCDERGAQHPHEHDLIHGVIYLSETILGDRKELEK
jgi:hypothetical protein